MSELITGKEALIALANGEDVQIRFKTTPTIGWCSLDTVLIQSVGKIMKGGDDFRIKPKVVVINGIEVPAPFNPEKGELYYYLSDEHSGGYSTHNHDICTIEIAVWKTEEDIKKVIEALRSIFNVK